ncbi:pali-domain-containing protein [Xylariales sp. AK1849]|nr:pali-domain-containing protein [Xylariales sp. AK1849]
MGRTGFFHHIGSFLLLVATVLLIVTCISAPVVHNLSMLKISLDGEDNDFHPDVTFGTFGYCVMESSGDSCSRSHVGYDAASVVEQNNFHVSNYKADTVNALTKVQVLHPVACVLSFIAFLLALGAGIVGSFLAALVALLAFLVTLVVLITDFVGFAILKNAVNSVVGSNAHAEFGAAAWTLLASAICNLLATVVVFFTCCSARLHKKRNTTKTERYDDAPAGTTRTRRRWF